MAADIISVDPVKVLLPRNTLVVLVGPAGCGKSTFASRHFRRTQVVSSDECRALVCDDPADQRVSAHAFELMHLMIKKRLSLGRLTVCDATNLEPRARRPLLRMARQNGFKTVAIVFKVPLSVCVRRNSSRHRVVPGDALRNQHAMLDKTLKSIYEEDFDNVFTLDQHSQPGVVIEISKRASRARGK